MLHAQPERDRRPLAGLLLALCLAPAVAQDQDPVDEKIAPTAFNKEEPTPKPGWGVGDGKSYWVPAADIVGFQVLLNLADRVIFPDSDYDVTFESIEDNFKGSWVYDEDPFEINQFGHPYQGSIYQNFARTAGHGFWTSMTYTVLGSALWEVTGETTPPSINDQMTTGFGGTFFGESLFRLSSLLLESAEGPPGKVREFVASALSANFNRWAFGDRFDGVFPSRDPAVYTKGQVGVNLNAQFESDVDLNDIPGNPSIPQSYDKGEVVADFAVAYGLPGKPGYRYDRPFDYFHMQLTAATGNVLENLMVRGMLYAADYQRGENYRGLWGVYGTYDYVAPQIFRISTTGLGLGSVGQWWLSKKNALQGEIVIGGGYGSGGVIDGRGPRDYHNGLTPQALGALRLILSDDAAIDVAGRGYYITDAMSDEKGGAEAILRGDVGLTFRVFDVHGISLKYITSRRNAHYVTLQDTDQTVGAVSLSYAYLGHKWFGAVDWRPQALDKTAPTLQVPLPAAVVPDEVEQQLEETGQKVKEGLDKVQDKVEEQVEKLDD